MPRTFGPLTMCGFLLVIGVSLYALTGASAASSTGGYVWGYVYGYDQYDQLIPIVWAQITAKNQQFTLTTNSGNAGRYEIFLPGGQFTLTVDSPGYKTYSMTIFVADGSSSNINFYLERSNTPIPEYPPFVAPLVLAAAFVFLVVRSRRKQRVQVGAFLSAQRR